MWFLALTCIMAPIISVTFLGISLNGGKTYMWRQREKGTTAFQVHAARLNSQVTFSGRGKHSAWISLLCEEVPVRAWGSVPTLGEP